MARIVVATIFAFCSVVAAAGTGARTTSISEAQVQVEANLKTDAGKLFDERIGREFAELNKADFNACARKESLFFSKRTLTLYAQLEADGNVQEVLVDQQTPVGRCVREVLLRTKFDPPPHPLYWVSFSTKKTTQPAQSTRSRYSSETIAGMTLLGLIFIGGVVLFLLICAALVRYILSGKKDKTA